MTATRTLVVDCSDIRAKRLLLNEIGALQGLHEFRIKERKRVRSESRNNRYWADWGPVEAARQEFERVTGEPWTKKEAHRELKRMFLDPQQEITSERSGETLTLAKEKTTTKLTDEEFDAYSERICRWLAEFFGRVVV